MKTHGASIFVFVASIIVGILISLNINFGKKTSRIVLNSKQYQEAFNTKTKLQKEIANLTENYNQYFERLHNYEHKGVTSSEIKNDIQDEAYNNKLLLGETQVKGEGLRITVNDSKTDSENFSMQNLVHDSDIINIINDFKNAGAEAICVNGHRITQISYVVCGNAFIILNGIKEPAPFVVEAIGKKETMLSYMQKPENYITYLKGPLRNLSIKVEEVDEIFMPTYDGVLKKEYLSEVK